MNKDDIMEILAIPLVGIVPDHEEVIVSANKGAPAAYNEDSVVGEAYRRIARRLCGEPEVPYIALTTGGFWKSFKRMIGFSAGGAA